MAVERYGSKTDVIVKLVLVFFIALLSFSIGTFVGKKFSDNQHKLADLEPGTHDSTVAARETDEVDSENGSTDTRGVASVNPNAHEIKPDKALSDDEIAKLAEEFVVDDEKSPLSAPAHLNDKNESAHTSTKNETTTKDAVHAPAKQESHPAATHTDARQEPKAEALKPAQRMAEGKTPVVPNPAVPTSRIPSSLPKEIASSALGKYTVQVGAYATEKEAQAMAADLKKKGFEAFYVSAQVKGKTYYRVSLGLFSTETEAKAYMKDILDRKKISSALVQKVTSAE